MKDDVSDLLQQLIEVQKILSNEEHYNELWQGNKKNYEEADKIIKETYGKYLNAAN